ncbi:MAG: ABC transporter permease [Chloroflexi bacterium]|nr:ABC transporter permease [Chloroflexota bacterium]
MPPWRMRSFTSPVRRPAMSLDRTLAIAQRLVRQIRRDRRTMALMVVAPVVVLTLIGLSFAERSQVLDFIAPAVLATFSLLFVFLLTGIGFLRERASGTLDRLLATPVGRFDLLVGYLLGFLGFAALQALIILLYTVYVLNVTFRGNLWEVILFLLVLTATSVNLGIFVSTFAHNEFQVMQFIPLLLAPQIFLSGIFLRVGEMPGYLQAIATVLPLRYAVDGLRALMLEGAHLPDVARELAILVGIGVVVLGLASLTVRRV